MNVDFRVGSLMVFVWIHYTEKCQTSFPQWCFMQKQVEISSCFFHHYPESYIPFSILRCQDIPHKAS